MTLLQPCCLLFNLHASLACFSLFFSYFFESSSSYIFLLSLHDALPIWSRLHHRLGQPCRRLRHDARRVLLQGRSEEHTSELQSLTNLVCRLLLEKKKNDRWFGCRCSEGGSR